MTAIRRLLGLAVLVGLVGSMGVGRADPPAPPPDPGLLTLDSAVNWALKNNPEMTALRQQHQIAEAGVVIADTFPFNPLLESRVQDASGPHSAGITNRTPNEHLLFFTLELWGQGKVRREGAAATLSRTDWEIASLEQTLAVRVMRAFRTMLYRQEKLKLAGEVIRLNEEAAKKVQEAVNLGKLRIADLILARSEVDNARALVGVARNALIVSRGELLRALGAVDQPFTLEGVLDISNERPPDLQAMLQVALENRADLRARRMAVEEADARLRLEQKNRFGNPTFGPAYVYDPTGVQMIGAQLNLPLPIFNRKQGEIMQREAERTRAELDVQRVEIQIRQDVRVALERLEGAQKLAVDYKTEVIPNLERDMTEIEKLFGLAEPGVDLQRVLDIRRKLLRARDLYLDALWEVNQARTDLAAALGEPLVAAIPCGTATPPTQLPNVTADAH